MNCEAIDEALGAYALDALSTDETLEVRAHLETCRRHDEALAGLRDVATRLPSAAAEREPPRALRGRLLDAFDAEVAAQDAPRRIETARAGVRWSLPRPSFVYAAAAALVLAVAGLLSWNLALQFGGDGAPQATVTIDFSGAAGSGRVVYVPEEHAGIMEVDLQEPPEGRTYQAWAVYEGGPVSLGTMPWQGVAAFQADLSDASAVAISEEPVGGSEQPTSDPLVVAELP